MTCRKVTIAHAGLLRRKQLEGGHILMEAVFTTQQDAHEQQQVQGLQGQASDDWWLPGHPGWAIWPADSDEFLRQVSTTTAALLVVSSAAQRWQMLSGYELHSRQACKVMPNDFPARPPFNIRACSTS